MGVFRDLTDEEQKKLGLANLDVLLSSRASEQTLATLVSRAAKDQTLKDVEEILNLILTQAKTEAPKESTLSSVDLTTAESRVILKSITSELMEIKNLLKLILS